MPELPEVESVRRTLEPHLLGARIERAHLRRRDICHGSCTDIGLLVGATIVKLRRHGKQLAIIGSSAISKTGRRAVQENDRAIVIHLGMSGQLFIERGDELSRTHVHCVWTVRGANSSTTTRLIFRDPRRFGGLWTGKWKWVIGEHWTDLGPDAATIDAGILGRRLAGSRQTIKAALLDQEVLAGVGNIYADESLHRAHLHPETIAGALGPDAIKRLAKAVREALAEAIDAGGSTLRDYRNGDGETGKQQLRLAVYGRGGKRCFQCNAPLLSGTVAQRTTIWCPTCQRAAR
ncbi:MAG: bifunctional DNA-formamidopyrimidine glycosylase/DNA-(apurinic or apyrimidinic site) lyase [Phycisphaerales bacterium]|nr:bifunctional DNA-formamidopyrimidine glycosylase/DNA-(apurinic or apyrimidinic site) lyase [Phycisphaerales bacterium]